MKQQPVTHCYRQIAIMAAPSSMQQQGMSLIMVMLIMVVISMLGISGVQIAMMAERGARNDRDIQIAFQAAEAALIDAEFDITGKVTGSARVSKPFDKDNLEFLFFTDCAGTGDSLGLCKENATDQPPVWLQVDFTDTTNAAKTIEFGKFTGRAFKVGTAGIQPAQKPRYIIELLRDYKSATQPPEPYFRVTAMGFGPRADIQVVLQMMYRN